MLIKASYACYYAEIAILIGLLLYKFVWWDVRFYYFVGLFTLYIGVGFFHYILAYWTTCNQKCDEDYKIKKFSHGNLARPFILAFCVVIYEFFTSPVLPDICYEKNGILKVRYVDKLETSPKDLRRTIHLNSDEAMYFFSKTIKMSDPPGERTGLFLQYENSKFKKKWVIEVPWELDNFRIERGYYGTYSLSYWYSPSYRVSGVLTIENGEITLWCYET